MSSLQRLFGRNDLFFDLLEGGALEAQNTVALVPRLLAESDKRGISEVQSNLGQSLRKHKRLSQQVVEDLTKVFVTPIEREDIEALSSALHKITKTCEKICDRVAICPPGTDLTTITEQVALIGQGADLVEKMVGALRAKTHGEQVRDLYERLQAIEGEADRRMNEQLRTLYTRADTDARQVVFWKDIYELLEKGVDRCRDAGNIVFHIVLKNS
jgi:uncharacterized protein